MSPAPSTVLDTEEVLVLIFVEPMNFHSIDEKRGQEVKGALEAPSHSVLFSAQVVLLQESGLQP